MYIERLQVEEGFLDGLDCQFFPGLNVVIGARGTGKTSLIELIRFCLGARAHTPEAASQADAHARGVLGKGIVTVTLRDGETAVVVRRSTSDAEPRTTAPFTPPIVFSQSEIETVGAQGPGRLRLIDGFTQRPIRNDPAVASRVRTTTKEMSDIRAELANLTLQSNDLPAVETLLKDLKAREAEFAKQSATARGQRDTLDKLTQRLADLTAQEAYLGRVATQAQQLRTRLLRTIEETPPLDRWLGKPDSDPLAGLRAHFDSSLKKLSEADHHLITFSSDVLAAQANHNQQRVSLETEVRDLRKAVESLYAGSGELIRQATALAERRAHLLNLRALAQQKNERLAELTTARDQALLELERARTERFAARQEAAELLTEALGPRVRVAISRESNTTEYRQLLTDALRGSGLKYNDLAGHLAERISPRELVEFVETADAAEMSTAAELSRERAARIIGHLANANLGELLLTRIEDDVDFQLLDGADYKPMNELSTGQRCTVVLPLILQHSQRVVVLDQPEDHIDNAFIVETVIHALQALDPNEQAIISTHNANIPVLGDARVVLQMESDGRRGFVAASGPVHSPSIVHAITSIMEGGKDAFRRRAEFYAKHRAP